MKRYTLLLAVILSSYAQAQGLLYDDAGKPIMYAATGVSGNGTPFSDSLYQRYMDNGRKHLTQESGARQGALNTPDQSEETLVANPNPFEDEVLLDFESGSTEVWSLKLVDMKGVQVHEEMIYPDTEVLNLPTLGTGLYTILLSSNTGKVYSQKLVRK